MNPWDSEIQLDETRVRHLITEQFQQLSVRDVRYLAEGWDSLAFEVNGDLIFRFPKRAERVPWMIREIEILPILAPLLPLRVSAPEYVGSGGAEYPFPFAGYHKIFGLSAENFSADRLPPNIPRSIGRFLSRLHSFSIDTARARGVPPAIVVDNENRRGVAEPTLARIAHLLPMELHRKARKYFGSSDASIAEDEACGPVLLHGELIPEHVILETDGSDIAGIIDWGDMCIGDPAVEFSGLRWWGGEAMVRQALSEYRLPVDGQLVRRTRHRAICAAISLIRHGMEGGRESYIRDGVAHLTGEL